MAINLSVLEDIKKKIAKTEDDFMAVMLEKVKERTPVDTGYLQARWQIAKTDDGYEFSNDAPYAGFVEFGHETRNHESFVPPVNMAGLTILEAPKHMADAIKRNFS